eukprot:TRINITY_DN67651_c4_g1_i2.p1 TRINITY_DN67651_c4_g1~~TRINITY_DN67651_c4_g1_i2.p1  ORF type:complete len:885 (-),score=13.74 TRINITY_DN67651_c4_g1_i2:623-3025(-)
MQAAFPKIAKDSSIVILIWSSTNQSILRPSVRDFTFQMNFTAHQYQPKKALPPGQTWIVSYSGYYVAEAMRLPNKTAHSAFVSASGDLTLIAISIRAYATDIEATNFAVALEHQMDNVKKILFANEPDVVLQITGVPAMLPAMIASAEHSLGLMDGIVLPLAMLVLSYILRCFRLMILPLMCIGVAMSGSFAIMLGVSKFMHVFSATPSLMMSILIAMSIDYSLFLLTRFREELLSRQPVNVCCQRMVCTAGHTIIVSGFTLVCCFLGLLFFPLDMLQSMGLGCAVCVGLALAVNITLTPAMLMTFPNFFGKSIQPCPIPGFDWLCGKGQLPIEDQEQLNADPHKSYSVVSEVGMKIKKSKEQMPLIATEAGGLAYDNSDLKGLWVWLGRKVMRTPINIIIILVVIGCVIPIGVHAFGAKTSDSFTLDMPRGKNITTSYIKLIDEFGYGTAYPYWLLLRAPGATNVVENQADFNTAASIIYCVAHDNSEFPLNLNPPNSYQSFVYALGQKVPWGVVESCLPNPNNTAPYCNGLRYSRDMFASKNGSDVWAAVELEIDPVGRYGDVWLKAIRKVMANCTQPHPGWNLYLSGLGSDSMDAISTIYGLFPVMISITGGLVLLFVGVSFKSATVPVRSVLTIGLTLLFVYGFADLTYQHGALNWLHFAGLKGQKALMWLPPVMSFSIIVGIALDYDIFLLVRIKEFYDLGWDTKPAILRGLCKTGGIITAAGVIMAIAFSGLLFSDIGAMNQLSFYMVFAVLFDTFVIRSLVVPAAMSLLDDYNWWPFNPGGPLGSQKTALPPW